MDTPSLIIEIENNLIIFGSSLLEERLLYLPFVPTTFEFSKCNKTTAFLRLSLQKDTFFVNSLFYDAPFGRNRARRTEFGYFVCKYG